MDRKRTAGHKPKKGPALSRKSLVFMARPRGFEPLTSASGGRRLGSVWSEVGGSKSLFVSNLQAGRKLKKNSFNTASYTIYLRFGHTLVRLEMALTGQNDRCSNCLFSSFAVYYANSKLRKNVWF